MAAVAGLKVALHRNTALTQNDKKRDPADTPAGHTALTITVMFNTFYKEHTMTPWIKKTLIGLTSATVLVVGLTACGTRGMHHERVSMSEERVVEMRGKVMARVSDQLELNEAQKQKLGLLADEMIAQRKAMRGDSADPRSEMKALIAGNTFDRTRAQTLLTQKTTVVQAGGPKVIAAMADFYDSLNPTQQAQVRERLDKRGGWWGRN